jgi:predicted alpha-1,2-mannosidase
MKSPPVSIPAALCLIALAHASTARAAETRSPVDSIQPMIGASTTGKSAGKTFPGPCTPFGLVQLSPDTITGGDNTSGYSADHTTIEGFSFTHMSGVGWYGEFGNLQVMPETGDLLTDRDAAKSPFDKKTEVAKAGYYAVTLDRYHVTTELTASPHAGILRFTYPASPTSRIKVDLLRRIGGHSIAQYIKQVDPHTVEGWMDCNHSGGGWGHGKGKTDYTLHFVMKFSVPAAKFGIWDGAKLLPAATTEYTGKESGFFVEFPTTAHQQVLVKAGISFVSIDGARANLEKEIPAYDFDSVLASARSLWTDAMKNVSIDGGTDDQRSIFYTALYHTMIDPRSVSDVDGQFLAPDHTIQHSGKFVFRTCFSGWDVFRSQFPLQNIINPELVNDEVNSLMEVTADGGSKGLARWELMGVDSGCMTGDPAVSVFADAYLKNIRGYDVQKAYDMVRNVVLGPNTNRLGFTDYAKLGYVPQSITKTVEAAYYDYCAAKFADALGKTDDAALLYKRALSYKNIWDPAVNNLHAKEADGRFTPWKGLTATGQGCVESNPYQQTWFAPQDPYGLIALYGGPQKFTDALNTFFEKTPADMQWNDYYNHSDEPVHTVPFLFTYAGAPWLTQKWSRFICDHGYTAGVYGICGNEDVGQMSAWYVLAAAGFHPETPCGGVYILTSPLFDKTTFHLDHRYHPGDTFTVIAHHNSKDNLYIQSATLNGKPLQRAWITPDEVFNGGTLEVDMGSQPNKSWGSAPSQLPPSPIPSMQTASAAP